VAAWQTDPNCAVALLEEAASNGLVGPSLITVGGLLSQHRRIPEGVGSERKASDAGGDTLAMNRLADMLLNGKGTADPEAGVALLEEAIAEGLRGPSFNLLGDHYRNTGDPAQAIQAYQQASDAGQVLAMASLADIKTSPPAGRRRRLALRLPKPRRSNSETCSVRLAGRASPVGGPKFAGLPRPLFDELVCRDTTATGHNWNFSKPSCEDGINVPSRMWSIKHRQRN
jgi:hypothetical protein